MPVHRVNNSVAQLWAPAAAKAYNIDMEITLPELEEAINYWRTLRPSRGEERALSPEVNSLASVYAMMIFSHEKAISIGKLDHACRQLIDHWREQRVT